ncbi:hypothetical protein Raf01_48470 [Rugosimonospora africana]|uniref:Uncharacterized protein n=1 Tax=Rugosimonospora africana TaxID=556532 RepID=A0A8J3VRX0_9ACTN|nr:hypothetical protein Raf01_48470 [Rugosimonospora africana]
MDVVTGQVARHLLGCRTPAAVRGDAEHLADYQRLLTDSLGISLTWDRALASPLRLPSLAGAAA